MLSALDIVRLAEARQAAGTAQVASESEPIGAGVMTFEAPGSWANQACGMADAPVSGEDLDRLVAFYTERGVEPRLEVCSYAHRSLWEGLESRQFVVREIEHVLVHDLRTLPECRPVVGLVVSRVDPNDEGAVDEFVETVARGFSAHDRVDDTFDVDLSRRMVRQPQLRAFLARIDEVAVGVGQMGIRGPIAGLFAASVRRDYRRRGIHRTLFEARLAAAIEEGCEAVVVESAPGGPTERNARRVGMRLLYTKTVFVRPGPGLARSV